MDSRLRSMARDFCFEFSTLVRETLGLVEWAVLSVLEAMMFWIGLLTWKVLVRFWKGYEGQDWDMAVSHL
jgi:hypothetical protein